MKKQCFAVVSFLFLFVQPAVADSYTIQHPQGIRIAGNIASVRAFSGDGHYHTYYMYADGRCGQLLKQTVSSPVPLNMVVEAVPRPIDGSEALTALEDRCTMKRDQ